MPRGWYLAQGLIPLGEASSDDEEGPCELPDGRLVCGPHGLVVCYKCCSDYNFDLSDDSGDDDLLKYESRSDGDNLPKYESRADDDNVPKHENRSGDASTEEANATREGIPGIHPLHPYFIAADSGVPHGLPDEPKRRGTGRVFPTKFDAPPSVQVHELFETKLKYVSMTRFVRRTDSRQVLVYTDGACLNNGEPNATAGWAFVHGPAMKASDGSVTRPELVESGRLEQEGPFKDAGVQSSNRAELRAVIAALRFRSWSGEGFKSIVIATDSEYVVEGATNWVKRWVKNGWKTNRKAEVKNRDMWEHLLGEVERADERGLKIEFWRIPRAWNEVADGAAKTAAGKDAKAEWVDMLGFCI